MTEVPGRIPVIVISLRASTQRRAAMTARMSGLGVEFGFFDAIDGKSMTAEEVQRFDPRPVIADFGKPLTPGEIGCIASFHEVFLAVAKGPDEYVCVSEDDAFFTEQALRFLDPALLASLPKFDVLRLGGLLGPCTYGVTLPGDGTDPRAQRITIPLRGYYHMTCQIVARRSASKLAGLLIPTYGPIDYMLYRDPTAGLRIMDVRPFPVGLDDVPTTMDNAGRYQPDYPGRKSRLRQLQRGWFFTVRKALLMPCFIRAWGWRTALRLRRYRAQTVRSIR